MIQNDGTDVRLRSHFGPGQRPSQRMKRAKFADQEKILAALQPNRPRLTWLQTAFDYIVLLPLSFILGGAFVLIVYAYRAITYAARVEKVLASLEPTWRKRTWGRALIDYFVYLPFAIVLGAAFWAYERIVSCPWFRGPPPRQTPTYKDGPWPISKDEDEE